MAVEPFPFGDQLEKALWKINKSAGKRIFTEMAAQISKMLAVGTEPFFRRDMGERHFSGVSAGLGFLLWLFATIGSCFTGSVIRWLLSACFGLRFSSMFGFFCHVLLPLAAGGFVIIAFLRFANENSRHIMALRGDGQLYHSRSRGRPRWDPATEQSIKLFGSIVLFLLAPVVGIAFIASMGMCSRLAAQQQAEILERYLDMVDAKLEGEFLQDALEGKCSPELTYLYGPLPQSYKPEVREDIAAAAVGKPVRMVAQRPKASPRQEEAKAQTVLDPPKPAPTQPAQLAAEIPAKQEMPTVSAMLAKIQGGPLLLVLALIVVCVIVGAIVHSGPSKSERATDSAQSNPEPLQPSKALTSSSRDEAPIQVSATPVSSPVPVNPLSTSENREDPRRLQLAAPVVPTMAALELQKQHDAEKYIKEIENTIRDQAERISQFKSDCELLIAQNSKSISKLSRTSRKALQKRNEQVQALLPEVVRNQGATLREWQKLLPALPSARVTDLQRFAEKVEDGRQMMANHREKISAELDEIAVAISETPPSKGFLFIK